MAFNLATFLGENAGAAFGKVAEGIGGLIAKFKADPTKVMEMEMELRRLQVQAEAEQLKAEVALSQAQTKINEIEAGSSDKFTSRWRPALGWVCVVGFSYAVLWQPLITWMSGWIATGTPPPAPTLNTDVLTSVMFGMLGLGAMRSFDKKVGTARP